MPPPLVEACRSLRFDGFSPRERAALEFARKAAADVGSIGQGDFDQLRAFFKPEEIAELAAVIASFMMYNAFVTVLGLELEPQQQVDEDVSAPS